MVAWQKRLWVIARKRLPEAIRLNLLFCQVSNSQNIHYGGQGDVKVMIPKQWSVLIETRSMKLERLQEDFWEKSQNDGFVPDSQILSSLLDFQYSTYIYHLCFSQPTFWLKHAFCHLSRGSSCAQNLSFFHLPVPSGSLLLFDAASSLWSSKDQGRSWSKVAEKLPFGQGTEQAVLVTGWQSRFFFHILIGPKWEFHYRHMAWANESTQEHGSALDSWFCWSSLVQHFHCVTHEQVAFVRYCRGFLVAVTMSTRVWMSVDACFYLVWDGMLERNSCRCAHADYVETYANRINHRFQYHPSLRLTKISSCPLRSVLLQATWTYSCNQATLKFIIVACFVGETRLGSYRIYSIR